MSKRSEVLFDHIADYLRFIYKAHSFWFTLNTSYDHGCHLANRFRLDPEEYEALLIVAGLASYTRFSFHPFSLSYPLSPRCPQTLSLPAAAHLSHSRDGWLLRRHSPPIFIVLPLLL
jgi:hypothetical protein